MSPMGIRHQAIATIGRCIYCGRPPTGREHAIPRGLNGVDTLEAASCGKCAGITSRYEMEILRGALLPLRIVLDLYTSDPKERPSKLPVVLVMPDRRRVGQMIPAGFHPAPLALPLLYGPTYLTGESRPMQMSDKQWTRQFTDPALVDQYLERVGAVELIVETLVDPTPLVRVIAKIAYCYAVPQFGLDGFTEVFLPNVAAPTTTLEALSPYVGGLLEPAPPEDNLHTTTIEVLDDGLVLVAVRLLARFGAPTYVAIVGRTRPGDGNRNYVHGVRIEPNHPILGWPIPENAQHLFDIVSRKKKGAGHRH